jgi:hypothetical protein
MISVATAVQPVARPRMVILTAKSPMALPGED